MKTQENQNIELTQDDLESVSGGTTDPADLNLILQDYHAKYPNGTVTDLIKEIREYQIYTIEADGDVRPFRFYYDPDSAEMKKVLNYLSTHF